MKMGYQTTVTTLVVAFVLVQVSIAGAATSEMIQDSDLCSIAATKRMLKDLGISSTKRCILQKKRDVGHLVTSYLEETVGSDDFAKRSLLDEFEVILREELEKRNSKRGAYCCSPKCDKFMSRMGKPHAGLIKCD